MNKFLYLCLACVSLIQESVASEAPETDELDPYTPMRRSSSFRSFISYNDFFIANSSKRSRENSEVTSTPDKHVHPQKRESSTQRNSRIIFEFSADHKNDLKKCGISDTQINRLELLQTIFFRSPHGDRLDPRSYLTQAELDTIYAKLDSDDLRSLVFTLKSLYDQKIPLSAMSPNTIYTPAARLSCTEPNGPKAKEINDRLSGCENLHVEHVTGYTFVEEEAPETPEERIIRHRLKEELFKTLEAERGKSDEAKALELNEIEQIWSKYFSYLQLRIKSIDEKKSLKIKCGELQEAFIELISSASYTKLEVSDCVVYFRKKDIDLARRNTHKTNKQLLSEGLAPIGADGAPMELHHLTRRHPGILVLMTQGFHQQHTALLHLRSEKHMRQPQPVDRAIFASWKKVAFTTILEALNRSPEEFDPTTKLFSETDLLPQDEETM